MNSQLININLTYRYQMQNDLFQSILCEVDDEEVYIITSRKNRSPPERSIFIQDQITKNINISIPRYQIESFYTFQTQTYIILVQDKLKGQSWQIKRNFQDIRWIFKSLSIDHIGYIIPCFPDRSLENELTSKVNLQKQKHKSCVIKTISDVNQFLNSVYRHEKLKFTHQAKIFITKNQEDFELGKNIMQNYLNQIASVQSNSNYLQCIIQKGRTFLTSILRSYNNQNQTKQVDIQFQKYENKIKQQQKWVQQLYQNLQNLINIKKSESIKKLDILNLSNAKQQNQQKISQLNIKFAKTLESDVLIRFQNLFIWINQIFNILQHLHFLKEAQQQFLRIQKLQRRIEKLENNFRDTWNPWLLQLHKITELIITKFRQQSYQYNKQYKFFFGMNNE